MKTVVYDWKKEIKNHELSHVIDVLNHDGVVVFPTDTVYGIGGNCFSDDVIEKLFEFKMRSYDKPINVLTDSYEKIKLVSSKIDSVEKRLISQYMPGALTVILRKKKNVSNVLTANLGSVGVRIPNHEIALKILGGVSFPLATTSANISGKESGICFDDIFHSFDGKVDVIIDGGISPLKIASTIVKVENGKVYILREGSIKVDEVWKI